MRVPLKYQSSEYDCVPTTFLNAINFLFDRKNIPPEVIKAVMLYSLDTFNRNGEVGKDGTTGFAIEFLCNWLNSYNKVKGFKVECERLDEKSVDFEKNNELINCLNNGGVILARVYLSNTYHYVLMTHMDKDSVYLFDPYFRKRGFQNKEIIIIDNDYFLNRKITRKWFNAYRKQEYSLSVKEDRVCILIRRV